MSINPQNPGGPGGPNGPEASFSANEPIHPTQERSPESDALEAIERGAFFSEIDRQLARDLADRLTDKFIVGYLNIASYRSALESLTSLIPTQNGDHLQIADSVINTGQRRLIESRSTSQEVDVLSPEGCWGSLPEIVKDEITRYGSLKIELTNKCTAMCPFCSYADKGPITRKVSFESAIKLISVVAEQSSSLDYHNLYWGTDPLDWISVDPTGAERDYADLVQAYINRVPADQQRLYSSTAVPLGVEFRVIKLAEILYNQSGFGQHDNLRISVTDKNQARTTHIKNILHALYEPAAIGQVAGFTPNRSEHVATRGAALEKLSPADVTPWDIVGPGCMDVVILSPDGISTSTMAATTSENVGGDMRAPLVHREDDATIYTIPKAEMIPYRVTQKLGPAEFTVVRVTDAGETSVEKTTRTNDPHRAFLELIVDLNLWQQEGRYAHHQIRFDPAGWPQSRPFIDHEELADYNSKHAEAVQVVRDHLNSGAHNPIMSYYMGRLEDMGLIKRA